MSETYAEEFLEVQGTTVHLLSAGEGEPLLLLHGAGSAAVWSPVHAELARSFRVLAPDHPGFGLSDAPEWLDGVDDLVYFYLDFLDQLGIDRTHVMGHSVGGWIAAELAVGHSHRLRKLALVNAIGLHVTGVEQPDLFAMSPAESAPFLAYDKEAAQARVASAAPEQAAIRDKGRAALARLGWNPYLHDPKLMRRLRRVRVPTLVVWGENDPLLPLDHGRAYTGGIPGARLATIPLCGHSPQSERPQELARLVLDFLRERED
ncbi:MAG: alpha/beta hydrolase [Chloroflexi bacterium]|nr:alpha/beta hydrolase [Chloroflexota bacterium]